MENFQQGVKHVLQPTRRRKVRRYSGRMWYQPEMHHGVSDTGPAITGESQIATDFETAGASVDVPP